MMWNEQCGALIACMMLACAMTSYGQQASDQKQISMSQKYPELDSLIHDIFSTNGKGGPNQQQQITTTEAGSKLNKQIEHNYRKTSLIDIPEPNWESMNKEYLEGVSKKSFTPSKETNEPNASSKEESFSQSMKNVFGENWDKENKPFNKETFKEGQTSFGSLDKENNGDYDTFFRNVFGVNWDHENKPINEENMENLFKHAGINAGGSTGLNVDEQSGNGLESKFGTTDTPTNVQNCRHIRVCPCKDFARCGCSRPWPGVWPWPSWPRSHGNINYIKPRLQFVDYANYVKKYPYPVTFYSYVNGLWWYSKN